MIGKRIAGAVAALGLLTSTVAATSTPAAAAVNFYFGIPGIYSAPPPNPSCWRWSHARQSWVWTCAGPHPNWRWDRRHRRWYR
jgi:hypothetical protein